MKTNLFKKATSALLALVMCLSTFIGIGSTTAYAAGEKAEAMLVSFPVTETVITAIRGDTTA